MTFSAIFAGMVREISIASFLTSSLPLIDVRSPGEYVKGHIPGSVNIPLFSDEERAHVGTVYTRESPQKATEIGYQYISPKLEDFVQLSKQAARDEKVAVHCWRGGMRSRAFAQHLDQHGVGDIYVIEGGYKAYRSHLHQFLDTSFKLRIIGGYTGSGKTEIIGYLADAGHQVVDLEALACHRGSSFGALGQETQPTVEQFENNLFGLLSKLNPALPVWMEDESRNIGGITIPQNLYDQMASAEVIFLDIPAEVRAHHLVSGYAGFPQELLSVAIRRISKRLGLQNATTANERLCRGDFYNAALLILKYYDKAYLRGMRFHDPEKIIRIPSSTKDPVINVNLILKLYE